jgi:hypothetical protein
MAIKRVDKKDIVDGQKLIAPRNPFLDPNSYIESGKVTSTEKYQIGNPYATGTGGLESSSTPLEDQTPSQISTKDVPQLTDIESVTFEQYYDPISKLAKYKAILKIRNSSKTPDNVAGVDARIYNPNA